MKRRKPHETCRNWSSQRRQALLLQKGMRGLSFSTHKSKHAVPEQPFDSHLLKLSRIYERSRKAFLKIGGQFKPALLSSPRTLSSAGLLTSTIEYSPIETEYIWAATDPLQKKQWQDLLDLRYYCTSVFHEQNHRILWKLLPPAPKNRIQVQHYLNFAESLIISLDAALADELGQNLASFFHLAGVIYDPGSNTLKTLQRKHEGRELRRAYRNYLHAMTYATYLNLEQYEFEEIHKIIRLLFSNLGPLVEPVTRRSLNLDRAFVERTNPFWQYQNWTRVAKKGSKAGLHFSNQPMDNRLQYLYAEKWFDAMGL